MAIGSSNNVTGGVSFHLSTVKSEKMSKKPPTLSKEQKNKPLPQSEPLSTEQEKFRVNLTEVPVAKPRRNVDLTLSMEKIREETPSHAPRVTKRLAARLLKNIVLDSKKNDEGLQKSFFNAAKARQDKNELSVGGASGSVEFIDGTTAIKQVSLPKLDAMSEARIISEASEYELSNLNISNDQKREVSLSQIRQEIAIGTEMGLVNGYHMPPNCAALGEDNEVYIAMLRFEPINWNILAKDKDLKARLKTDITEQLATLHDMDHYHGDIHKRNIMFNPGTKKYVLIDLGEVDKGTEIYQSLMNKTSISGKDLDIQLLNNLFDSQEKKDNLIWG